MVANKRFCEPRVPYDTHPRIRSRSFLHIHANVLICCMPKLFAQIHSLVGEAVSRLSQAMMAPRYVAGNGSLVGAVVG